MSFVKPKEAAKFYGVSETTLRDWANEKKIECNTTKGGHRRYKIIKPETTQTEKGYYIYARVSSQKQQGDLGNQIQLLRTAYPRHELITDIGSGLNGKRKGFRKILEELFQGNLKEVVVTHRDRWTRFHYELFEWIFDQWDAKLVSIGDKENGDERENELSEDLMSIVGYFHAKYYGKRKYKLHDESENLSDEKSDTDI